MRRTRKFSFRFDACNYYIIIYYYIRKPPLFSEIHAVGNGTHTHTQKGSVVSLKRKKLQIRDSILEYSDTFAFPSVIWSHKDQNIQNCNFTCCSALVWNLVSCRKWQIHINDAREQGTEDSTWTYQCRRNSRLEGTAKLKSSMICMLGWSYHGGRDRQGM